mmetsp:Transcript_16259/g.45072  ORF Transcript_16259/g.45072 Transcript_16259/m.45072 type:complete len:309 (+) Transcript_16259:137-1063(+)
MLLFVDVLCIAALRHHRLEMSVLLCHEVLWGVKFGDVAIVQDQNTVGVHDGVQSVRDGEHCGILEILADHLLDHSVCLVVDTGSGLVHDQYLRFSEQRPGDAQQLPLALREVFSTFGDHLIESPGQLFDHLVHADLLQHLPQLIVAVAMERIQVVPHGVGEDHWILRNDGEVVAEAFGSDLLRVDTVDDELTIVFDLGDAEESDHQTALSRSCSTDDTQLLPAVHGEGHVLENERTIAVSHRKVPELDRSLAGPRAFLRVLVWDDCRCFWLDIVRVVQDALDGAHVGLEASDHLHSELQVRRHFDGVR